MITYKIDVMKELKLHGFTASRCRKEKIFSESTMSRLRHKEIVNLSAINTICVLLQCQPSDVLKVTASDEELERFGIFTDISEEFAADNAADNSVKSCSGYVAAPLSTVMSKRARLCADADLRMPMNAEESEAQARQRIQDICSDEMLDVDIYGHKIDKYRDRRDMVIEAFFYEDMEDGENMIGCLKRIGDIAEKAGLTFTPYNVRRDSWG